ncbi:hypothetical protein B296_00033251 [Ensete ventricosum]|uniref:Uncharacterized protein n=1 Tax=Ensete ventricosum TaxID=4639 RepID=A0A426XCD8_ENSVE|nr:hypothetical protein B296_00033251 [Ensete ventricosum]
MIVPTKEPKLEDTTLEPKEKDTPQPATRTVPTLAGYTKLQKLKIKGFLEQQSVIILVDARSTHNFMSNKVATHLMLQKENYNGFKVKAANCQILKCNQKCPWVKLILQEQDVVAKFFLLPLDDFDIVFGIDLVVHDWRYFLKFLEANHEIFQKRKVGDYTREPSDYNHNIILGGGTKRGISGFPIQIQEFHEIEDKKPIP